MRKVIISYEDGNESLENLIGYSFPLMKETESTFTIELIGGEILELPKHHFCVEDVRLLDESGIEVNPDEIYTIIIFNEDDTCVITSTMGNTEFTVKRELLKF